MKRIFAWFALLAPCHLFAAGTYMGTSGYQSPQRYYQGGGSGGYRQPSNTGSSGYSGGNYYQRQGSQYSGGYGQTQSQTQAQPRTQARGGRPQGSGSGSGDGFYLSGGISIQYAQWNFDMNTSGSVLNYGDLAWNVLDVKGGYKFGNIVIDGGAQYGMQSGKTTMTDDDLTAGGMVEIGYKDSNSNNQYDPGEPTYPVYTRVLSTGESKGGSLFGLNVGVGLANKLGFGRTKITPSVGYRMFNYKLSTANNYGLMVTSIWCEQVGGEEFCPSTILGNDGSTTGESLKDQNGNYTFWWSIPAGMTMMSSGDTYSFHQSGKTHAYNVSWDGPYLAVDLDSELSDSNFVNARIELGFPGYSAKGDQPYRIDWAHPNSVEDSKGMFGAIHVGLLANWTTMITNSFGLDVGLTYDYYGVSKADSQTNLSGAYYQGLKEQLCPGGVCPDPATKSQADQIDELYASCGGSWSCKDKGEINSFYRSMGIRLGLSGKF
jgi:hypothetical protein